MVRTCDDVHVDQYCRADGTKRKMPRSRVFFGKKLIQNLNVKLLLIFFFAKLEVEDSGAVIFNRIERIVILGPQSKNRQRRGSHFSPGGLFSACTSEDSTKNTNTPAHTKKM